MIVTLIIVAVALHYCIWLLHTYRHVIAAEIRRQARCRRYKRHAVRHRNLYYLVRMARGIDAQLAYIERTAGRDRRDRHPP